MLATWWIPNFNILAEVLNTSNMLQFPTDRKSPPPHFSLWNYSNEQKKLTSHLQLFISKGRKISSEEQRSLTLIFVFKGCRPADSGIHTRCNVWKWKNTIRLQRGMKVSGGNCFMQASTSLNVALFLYEGYIVKCILYKSSWKTWK